MHIYLHIYLFYYFLTPNTGSIKIYLNILIVKLLPQFSVCVRFYLLIRFHSEMASL